MCIDMTIYIYIYMIPIYIHTSVHMFLYIYIYSRALDGPHAVPDGPRAAVEGPRVYIYVYICMHPSKDLWGPPWASGTGSSGVLQWSPKPSGDTRGPQTTTFTIFLKEN